MLHFSKPFGKAVGISRPFCADRVWIIDLPDHPSIEFPPLQHDGKVWFQAQDGTVTQSEL